MIAAKTGHGPISMVPLVEIEPHWLNDKIYGPVNRNDPDVKALAQSIKDFGLKEPLVVTSDFYVLSGHRRQVAAKLAGMKQVPCYVQDFDAFDERVPVLLVTYNRQRVKPANVVLREEVILSNPEEAYQELTRHRQRKEDLSGREVDIIELPEPTKRSKISNAKIPFLHAVIGILNKYKEYRPLTDRQIHYYLLNDPPLIHASKPNSTYVNDKKSYKRVTDLLTCARLEGKIPYSWIHDPTRPVEVWNCPNAIGSFVRDEINIFLKHYHRNLMQSQPNHVEIVGEKNTIAGIIEPVAEDYCIPLTIGRGYSSLPPRYEMAQRFKKSGKGQLVILFLSDFDPEGHNIPESYAKSMRDDFGIQEVMPVKVALSADQVRTMNLATDQLNPPKKSSSRFKKFVERYGRNVSVYELEAVPPDELQRLLREAINLVIDVDAFNAEIDREKEDAGFLDGVRKVVKRTLEGIPELNGER